MKHLLSINDLSQTQAISILDTALELARVSDAPMKKLPTLRGRTIVNLFAEDSTRTRISFEAAAKRLSADVINFSAKGSSVSKGESLKDTAQTLQAMGADAVIIRHQASGAPHRLASSEWMSGSVINAGDGTHEHPSQALLDSYTLRKHLMHGAKDLKGLHVAIVGDILHSRVARSNVLLLSKLGAAVTVVAPPTLLPVGIEKWAVKVSYDFDDVIAQADAIMMLRVQSERMQELYFPNAREYSRYFGLNSDRVKRMKKDSIIMHPGPMNRGLEITADVADSARSVIVEQVSNGVSVRMAILYTLLTGEGIEAGALV
ncbi:MAG: aspartate carbamoyltransferase catalytic subunit [Actinobacteria bacterium]|jgi:aspartate carbamoyltransferase catalytic subunit|nr:aspartate carbamoyltransferase catalytic subunit [Actinomycetota bacterium]NDH80443.1 aspartate carbamoyltransferase catalytic subunit [Actinomycetota bacterium]NDH98807.1 aspartate carbamoyltransferase catalytic subunit [Actinomycetota bacterium]NDI07402.1 aspartate carbamoyltransferase catalytic subunit [Actinomycetota bacterium]